MKNLNNIKTTFSIFIIIIWSLLIRTYFWPEQLINHFLYYESLENHLLEYIYKTGMKPPLMYLIQGTLVKLFGSKLVLSNHFMLILLIFLELTSFILIFITLILTKVTHLKSLIIILLYSVYQIPLEFWKVGTHYDSFSLFFNSIFISSIILIVHRPKIINSFILAISGSLLILYGSAFFLVVPLSIVLTLMLIKKINLKNISIKILGLTTLLLPIITILIICSKNYVTRDVFATSTFRGVALMLTTMRTVDRNLSLGDKIVENSSAPNWYKWCWKNAQKFIPNDYKTDYVALVNNKVFGQCVKFVNTSNIEKVNSKKTAQLFIKNDKNVWPFDMTELKNYLTKEKANVPLNAVNKDIDIMKNKKYLLFGTTPELALHWTDIYGEIGKRIFFEDFFNNPKRYFSTFIVLSKEYFIGGSQFPLILSKLNHQSPHFEGQFSNKIFTECLRFIGNILQLVVLINLLIFIYLFSKMSIYYFNRTIKFTYDDIIILSIGFPAILLSILYSTIIGEENSRYFLYSIPYFIISFAYIKSPIKIKFL